MRRRDLLATGAAVAIAGCSSKETTTDPSDDKTNNETDDRVDENETNNESDSEPETDENESNREDDTSEKDETEAQRRERVNEGIESAREYIKAAMETYRSFGDGETIADVGPGDTIDTGLVRDDLVDAAAAVDLIYDDAFEDQQKAVVTLETIIHYLDLMLAVDDHWSVVLEAGTALRNEILTDPVSASGTSRKRSERQLAGSTTDSKRWIHDSNGTTTNTKRSTSTLISSRTRISSSNTRSNRSRR